MHLRFATKTSTTGITTVQRPSTHELPRSLTLLPAARTRATCRSSTAWCDSEVRVPNTHSRWEHASLWGGQDRLLSLACTVSGSPSVRKGGAPAMPTARSGPANAPQRDTPSIYVFLPLWCPVNIRTHRPGGPALHHLLRQLLPQPHLTPHRPVGFTKQLNSTLAARLAHLDWWRVVIRVQRCVADRSTGTTELLRPLNLQMAEQT